MANAYGSIYNGILQRNWYLAQARNYGSCLEADLDEVTGAAQQGNPQGFDGAPTTGPGHGNERKVMIRPQYRVNERDRGGRQGEHCNFRCHS